MDNQETLAKFGTEDTEQRQTEHKNTTKHRKLKRCTLSKNTKCICNLPRYMKEAIYILYIYNKGPGWLNELGSWIT